MLAAAPKVQNRVPDGASWDGRTDLQLALWLAAYWCRVSIATAICTGGWGSLGRITVRSGSTTGGGGDAAGSPAVRTITVRAEYANCRYGV